MNPYAAEFIGTMLLVLFGNGVVANVVLAQTKGHGGGWIVITAGWGVAVFVGAFCAADYSGGQINPAVTTALVLNGDVEMLQGVGYIVAQFAGALVGGLLVYLFYREHFRLTSDADAKLACFATAPNVRNLPQAFFCEAIGTFALVLPIFLIAAPSIMNGEAPTADDPKLGLGSLGLLPVSLLVFGIGMSLGGTTGYAINPARDLGPRIVHALLKIDDKNDSDWSYAWVPVVGPITGAAMATLVFKLLV
jgi:glycerol uptake facilitator protein